MRLVCPNCGAQYEVDDRVIPESGRDVQCSACGHAWYQMSRDRPAAVEPPAEDALGPGDWEPEEEGDDEAATAADATPEPEPELAAAPEPAPDFEAEPEPDVEAKPEPDLDDEPEPEPEPAEPPQPAPARRPLDEGVADILQEEARHEIERRGKERSHEPEPVETQPDLGLDAATSPDEERRRIARERMARMRGLEEAEDEDSDGLEPPQAPTAAPTPEPTPAADDAPEEPAEQAVAESLSGMRRPEGDMPRRELFPDIEEINSTLDSRDAQAEAGEDARERRSGFARGFFLVVLIALIAVIVYILAPRLSDTIPALKPALSRYVAWVNEGRVWLDTTLQGVIAKIEAAAKSGQ